MKRWFLWNFYCLRGRRCANLVPEPEQSMLPPGVLLHMNYTCGGCGTKYKSEFRWNGHNFTGSRAITKEERKLRERGIVVQPGELWVPPLEIRVERGEDEP